MALRAFTLVEVLVATAVTALIAGLMIMVIANVMSVWRRSADTLQTNAQAKIALDYLARDLSSAIMQRDARAWLIATVQPDQTGVGDAGGTLGSWSATGDGAMKPGWGSPGTPTSSLNLAPAGGRFEDCRFGMAGVWLRLIAGVPDSNSASSGIQQASAPRAVGYQIVRHQLSGSSGNSSARYALFRAEVRPFHDSAGPRAASTLVNGYDLSAAAYTTATANNLADTGNIRRPRRDLLLGNNVVDFGVRFYTRDAAGNLVLAFPTSNANRGFAATTNTSLAPGGSSFGYGGAMTYGFPDVAEVFVRVLTEEGARKIEALESGRLPGLEWWMVAIANSEVFTRRIVITGRPL